jgi:hypothetical protein
MYRIIITEIKIIASIIGFCLYLVSTIVVEVLGYQNEVVGYQNEVLGYHHESVLFPYQPLPCDIGYFLWGLPVAGLPIAGLPTIGLLIPCLPPAGLLTLGLF